MSLRCPKCLSKTAKTEWKRVISELKRAGTLAAVDRAILATYCQAWSRWIDAEQKISETGLLTKAGGQVVANPLIGIANTAGEQLRKLAVELGLTPRSRGELRGARKPRATKPQSPPNPLRDLRVVG